MSSSRVLRLRTVGAVTPCRTMFIVPSKAETDFSPGRRTCAPEPCGGRRAALVGGHPQVRLSEEAAGAASGVIDGLADLGVGQADHETDDGARGEELSRDAVLVPILRSSSS